MNEILQEIAKACLENKDLTIAELSEQVNIDKSKIEEFLKNIVEEIDSQRVYDYIQIML